MVKDDPTPVEQIRERSKAQITRMKRYLEEVKGDLQQQIENNKSKKVEEKIMDQEIGLRLTQNAQDSIAKEQPYVQVKKEKAANILKKQWAEQVKLKCNE